MAIERVAQVRCDRCRTAADLTPSLAAPKSRGGPRNVKPVGWAHISMSAKVDLAKPVQVVKAADVCPDCAEFVLLEIANQGAR